MRIIPALLALAAAAAVLPAAAQQPAGPQNGGGTDMNAFMARCAQLRRQPGTDQTAQGRRALDQCDQMDRSMGITPPARR